MDLSLSISRVFILHCIKVDIRRIYIGIETYTSDYLPNDMTNDAIPYFGACFIKIMNKLVDTYMIVIFGLFDLPTIYIHNSSISTVKKYAH